jgi:hypothetical protein
MVRKILQALKAARDWGIDLFRVLSPSRWSVLIVLIGVSAFLLVPQGQDVLRRLAEWGPRPLPPLEAVIFFAAVVVWAVSDWYWARVILYLRPADSPPDTPRQERFRVLLPRALGTLALAGMGAALCRAGYFGYTDPRPVRRLGVLSLVCFVLAVAFLWVVTNRRELLARRRRRRGTEAGPQASRAPQYGETAADLPVGTRRAILLGLVVAILTGLAFTFRPIGSGELLGTVPILLITAATWVLFGTGILYLSRRLRVPLLVLLLLSAVVFSFWNDNHEIRVAPGSADTRPANGSIQEHFASWYGGIQGDPIFLVAAEGGGIRAAYWTAIVLGELQDRNPRFARHVFAISGISGGSVGAGVFDALLAQRRAENGGKLPCGTFRECAADVLGHDFLSPTLAKMIAPDLAQRFLPFPWLLLDRGRTLEDSWAAAWRAAVRGSNRFEEPFLSLWRQEPMEIPSLVFNATHVETGRRILTSNLKWKPDELDDVSDLLQVLRSDLPLKTAAHNSARFTYVSPAGTMKIPEERVKEEEKKSGRIQGHLVDGGYFENSGIATVSELRREIRRACGAACEKRIHVIYLRNAPSTDPDLKEDPADPMSYLALPRRPARRGTATLASASGTAPAEPPQLPSAKPYPGVNELLSPPRTLLQTRNARGSLAVASLRKAVKLEGANFFEIGLCERIGGGERTAPLPLPLGWQLSTAARQAMERQIEQPGCAGSDNPEVLRQICERLNPGNPAACSPRSQPRQQLGQVR